jgi:hypothetical protein
MPMTDLFLIVFMIHSFDTHKLTIFDPGPLAVIADKTGNAAE